MKVNKRNVAFLRADPLTIDSRSSPASVYVSEESRNATRSKFVRQRNRSSNSSDEFLTPVSKIPKISGSPSSIVTTHGYDLRPSTGKYVYRVKISTNFRIVSYVTASFLSPCEHHSYSHISTVSKSPDSGFDDSHSSEYTSIR